MSNGNRPRFGVVNPRRLLVRALILLARLRRRGQPLRPQPPELEDELFPELEGKPFSDMQLSALKRHLRESRSASRVADH